MDKFQQLAYEFSGAGFTQRKIVAEVMAITGGKFATEVTVDQRNSLNKGLALRYAENHPELNAHYVQQGENFVEVDDKAFKAFKGAKYHMTVANLLSIDKTEISKMAQHDKPRHDLVKNKRLGVMKYLSDAVKDMQSLAKESLNGGSGAPRKPNKNFVEAVEAMLFDPKGGLMKKAINAKASSDNSFDEDRWTRSMKAFKAEWTK